MEQNTPDASSRPDPDGRNVYSINGELIVLTDEQLLFVDTLHYIYTGEITEQCQLRDYIDDDIRYATRHLINSRREGKGQFWDAFDLQANKATHMRLWKPLIEQGTGIDEGDRAGLPDPLKHVGIRLDKVHEEKIEWLWKNHIALGKITIVDGDPGVGKSSMLLDMAAMLSHADLIIIDPIMAILGGHDTYKDSEVRMLLSPLQMMVEKYRAACVLVRHLNKGGSENMLYRGGGSIAFIGLARSAFSVTIDPEDATQSLLAPIKTNIGKPPPAFSFRITSDEEMGDDRPYVEWGTERYLDPQRACPYG